MHISAILTLNTAAHAVGTSLASIEAVEILGEKFCNYLWNNDSINTSTQ